MDSGRTARGEEPTDLGSQFKIGAKFYFELLNLMYRLRNTELIHPATIMTFLSSSTQIRRSTLNYATTASFPTRTINYSLILLQFNVPSPDSVPQ